MSDCTHDCNSCNEKCPSGKKNKKNDFLIEPNELSSIKRVIGVVSGKGGVGKSLITSMLAVMFKNKGFHTAILDADITGPSIPKAFGVKDTVKGCDGGMLPVSTETGIDIMSINLLLPNETDPVVWRGPVIAGTVKQFWTDVIWQDVDYMFVDMPPGTGDVPLTVFQSIPLDGIVIVTSPQELVSMIVSKAVRMARMMDIPVLGIIENMSYFECPDCGKRYYPFGKSKLEETADEYGLDILARLPIDAENARLCDEGKIEQAKNPYILEAAGKIQEKLNINL